MVWTGPVGQHYAVGGRESIPPPLAVRPELTDDDVTWLNSQMELTERPSVRYSRERPRPPAPPGRRSPPPTGWIEMTMVRG